VGAYFENTRFGSLSRNPQPSTPASTWGSVLSCNISFVVSSHTLFPGTGWKKDQAIPVPEMSLLTLLARALLGIGAAAWVPDAVCTTPWEEAPCRSTAGTAGCWPWGRLCCRQGPGPRLPAQGAPGSPSSTFSPAGMRRARGNTGRRSKRTADKE